jgi:WD40 repeat protein
MKKMLVMLAVASTGILIAAGYSEHANKDFLDPFDGSVDHIHGIGYIADDESLYAAAHTGLKIHRNGDWLRTTKNKNDYTSFTTVDQGFFASGIPEEGSDLPTPLGLQYSANGGEDLETIDFEGQANFHALAAGYTSHDIFLLNTEKEVLQGEGFYRSPDFGKTWDKASANGLLGAVNGLALHPDDSSHVAAASSTGIYLSIDGGENFQSLTGEGESGTAVFFSEDHLYFAGYDKGARLIRYDLQKEEMTPMKLPLTERDTAVSLAQHPEQEGRFAIYSLQGHIYITEDGAKTWEQILTGNKVH